MCSALTPGVVLRSNDICALGATRSLGSAGHRVTVAGFDYPGGPAWVSQESKYCTDFVQIANPAAYPDLAAEQLRQVLARLADETGVLPALVATSDTSLELFSLLEQGTFFAVNMRSLRFEGSSIDLNDKVIQSGIVSDSGLPVPGFADKATLIPRLRDGSLSFPLVVKPRKKGLEQSFYARNSGAKCLKFDAERDLFSSIEYIKFGDDLIFQDYICGDFNDELCVYLSRRDFDGSVSVMCGRKHLVTPHPFGTASILESFCEPRFERLAIQFAEYLRWDGLLMLEFKFDTLSGEWKYIEANFRPWLFVDFPRRMGENFLGHWLGSDGKSEDSKRSTGSPSRHLFASLTYLERSFREAGKKFDQSSVSAVLSSYELPVSLAEWDRSDLELSERLLKGFGVEDLQEMLFD